MTESKIDGLRRLDALVLCPYCGQRAELIDSVEIYGRSYGMAWICKPCDAYVGCHKGTSNPLGRLADKELRAWKKKAHAAFDPLWKCGKMKRGSAYGWLARKLNMSRAECHIGMMDVEQCKSVVGVCTQNRAIDGKFSAISPIKAQNMENECGGATVG